MVLTVYVVADGPPSLAVRMALKYLNVEYKQVDVDFGKGEHMTEEYAKMNPQKEIPVIDDDGFYLSESNAILQYIADKYDKEGKLYPKDIKKRAIVNHRLAFNLSTYYKTILEYGLLPIFFDYEKTEMNLIKMKNAIDVFNTYLQRLGTKYAAGDHVTIADFQLVTATMSLEAINFDFSPYKNIVKWYNTFKKEYSELWAITEEGLELLIEFEKNPPDLSHMNHHIHPIRKQT